MNPTYPSQKDQTRLAVLIADVLIVSGTLVSAYDSVRNIDYFKAVLPVAFGALLYLVLIVRRVTVSRVWPVASAMKVAAVGAIAATSGVHGDKDRVFADQVHRAVIKRCEERTAAAGEQQPIFRHVALKIMALFAMVIGLMAVLQ